MLITIVTIVILIMLSAFFSGSETGLTAASKAKIHKLKNEGNKRANMVSKLHEDMEKLIGAILLGNNLVNIAATVVFTTLCIKIFGDSYNDFLVTILMTLVILIFAEVAPKSYAVKNAEKVALFVAPIFMVLVKTLSPITHAIQFFVYMTMRIFGINIDKNSGLVRGDEILRGEIELQHDSGKMISDDKYMLGGILDLTDIDVDEVMLHRKQVYSVNIDLPNKEIIEKVLDSNFTRIPLWKESPDNIVGVLHGRDLLKVLGSNDDLDIENIDFKDIAFEPWFIPETTNLKDQLDAFRKKHVHFAFVVDEYGAILGILTLEDILEEIVGQIADETDSERSEIRKQTNGSYIIDGTATIRDINRELNWNLLDDDVSTLAGLVINEAQLIPNVGQMFKFRGYKFEVCRKFRNQLMSIRVTKIDE